MNNISITFLAPKGRINKAGQVTILCRLTQDKRRKDFSTGVSIPLNLWERKKHKAKGTTQVARNANTQLEEIRNDLSTILLNAQKAKEKITPEILRQRYQSKAPTHTILSLAKLYIEKEAWQKSEATRKNYQARYNNWQKFFREHLNIEDLSYSEVKKSLATDMFQYFREKKGFSHNHASRQVMDLKGIFSYAYKEEIVNNEVWRSVNYRQDKPETILTLTPEELNKLSEHTFEIERLQKIADCFVVQCFTGLAYSDLARLTQENIKANPKDNNRLWIYTSRQKTKVQVTIPLLPPAQKIIEKYGGVEKLPLPTNQKFNAYLKEIADILKIPKELTTHVGRKTFGNNVLNEYGLPIESVSKMLGHSNIGTTQDYYARTNEARVVKDSQEIWKHFDSQ